MTDAQLLAIKKEVDSAANIMAEKKGQQTAVLNQLASEFGCSTIIAADKAIAKLEAELQEMNQNIEELSDEISQKYDAR